ncbi:glycosyltransferase [Enterococcus hirae]|nr:glycosyltransferase family 2 protein [Enterococcus hirae]
MEISFVIVNYYTVDLVKLCIESLSKNQSLKDINSEIIIIDNSNSNEELKKLNLLNSISKFPVKVKALNKNMGFGYGNNIGSKLSGYENICFINSDVTADETDFNSLLLLLENKNYGIVSCVIKNSDNTLQSAGFEKPTLGLEIRNNLLFENFSFRKKNKEYSCNEISKVGWVSGAFFLIKKKLFTEIGGFDPTIFMYSEDLDIALTMTSMTGKLCIVDNSTYISHNQVEKKFDKTLLKSILKNKKNYYYVMEKHSIYNKITMTFVKGISFFNSIAIVTFKFLKRKVL